jgi:hypothetical protein
MWSLSYFEILNNRFFYKHFRPRDSPLWFFLRFVSLMGNETLARLRPPHRWALTGYFLTQQKGRSLVETNSWKMWDKVGLTETKCNFHHMVPADDEELRNRKLDVKFVSGFFQFRNSVKEWMSEVLIWTFWSSFTLYRYPSDFST